MTWLQRYRWRTYVRDSLWIPPVLAVAAAMVLGRLLNLWPSPPEPGWDLEALRAVMGNLAGAMFTFVVFVGSSLLLVVQLSSAQLTPRMIGMLLRDPVTKTTLSAFLFIFTFAISVLMRMGASIPFLAVEIVGYGSAGCLGLFVFLIDRVGRMVRPSGAVGSVASQAHRIIESVYPRRLREAGETSGEIAALSSSRPVRTVVSRRSGVVQAIDVRGLVELGERYVCFLELVPQVGDYVAPGNPLFRIRGEGDLPEESLHQSIALGWERTMEQDPAFAFRVLVDIASKALSPAINDPTTAVLALDRIHHLLRHLGHRCLEDEKVRDAAGTVRLFYRTPNWEDFVVLAVTEIRHYGGSSIQVARRLHAMLEDLIANVPEERAVPLRLELRLLRKSSERFFQDPEDRALAEVSDTQGVGGKHDATLPEAVPERKLEDGRHAPSRN